MRVVVVLAVLLGAAIAVAQPIGGRVFSFQKAVDASGAADRIEGNEDDEKAYVDIACCNNSTTVVYVGDVGAVDAANGFPICTTAGSCPSGACIEVQATSLYGHSTSGSVTLTCTAIQR